MSHRSKKRVPAAAPAAALPAPTPWWQRDWFLGLALLAVTTIAYMPAWNGQAIWDDDGHLTKPALQSLTGLVRIWIEPGAAQQYYPLVHSLFWLEYHLWGYAPLGYHLINILLHVLSAFLLVRILRQLEVPGAWLAAALFALHPVQVESVAWMSELKNTLSGVFYLGAGLVYLLFIQRRSSRLYALALGLFALGLASKSVIATLPAAILVILWWKRGKLSWKDDVAPLVPFFAISVVFGTFTAWMEHKFIGAKGSDFNFNLVERTLIAGRAVWFYLAKLAWPQTLIFIYPRWEIRQTIWWLYLFPAAVLAAVAGLWLLRRRSRAPLAVFLLFVGTLVPALGFVNIYPFLFSFVADHFQYLACIAPLTLAAAGVAKALPLLKSRRWIAEWGCGAVLAVLAILTWQQSAMYADMKTLWETTIARNPDCWMAYSNRGFGLLQEGKLDDAIADFKAALNVKPDYAYAHNNLGMALMQEGHDDEAVPHFQKALEVKPDYAEPYGNLGVILYGRGKVDEAIIDFQKAEQINPDYPDAYFNLGIAFTTKNNFDAAIAQFQKSLQLKPADPEAYRGMGLAFAGKGDTADAIAQFNKALSLKPDYALVLQDLRNIYAKTRGRE
ncbi:MAG TPA: tetratricopeptide repeat protein [Terriglobia bacterium]|jgi:Flp pilus assembly protein TadD